MTSQGTSDRTPSISSVLKVKSRLVSYVLHRERLCCVSQTRHRLASAFLLLARRFVERHSVLFWFLSIAATQIVPSTNWERRAHFSWRNPKIVCNYFGERVCGTLKEKEKRTARTTCFRTRCYISPSRLDVLCRQNAKERLEAQFYLRRRVKPGRPRRLRDSF